MISFAQTPCQSLAMRVLPAPYRATQVGIAMGGLAVLLSLSAAAAQEAKSLAPVVVSGSRSEQSTDDVAGTIDVVTQGQLEFSQVGDIRDVVRDIPNVSVQRSPARFSLAGNSTGRAGNAGFNIRGLDGNRVLILVDGVRMPKSYAFGSNSFGRDAVDVTQLKRVEIVKGPASALYGSDGLAGMVNFITREPSDYLGRSLGFGGQASVSTSGDDNGRAISATAAGRLNDSAQWLVSARVGRANALSNQGSNDSANADRTTPNPQNDKSNSVLAKLILKPGSAQRHAWTVEHVDKRSDYELLSARARLPLSGSASQVASAALRVDSFTTQERDRLGWDARYQVGGALADNIQTIVSVQRASSREWASEDRNTSADRVRDVTYDEKTLQLGLQGDKVLRMSAIAVQKLTYGFDFVRSDVRNLNTGVTPPFGETFPLKRFPDTREAAQPSTCKMKSCWATSPSRRRCGGIISASKRAKRASRRRRQRLQPRFPGRRSHPKLARS